MRVLLCDYFQMKFGFSSKRVPRMIYCEVYHDIIILLWALHKLYYYGFTVISSVTEPVVGWIDNVNGPIGLMVATGKGVTLVTLAHKYSTPDLMPVDVSIKGMILAAYHRGTHKYFVDLIIIC